MRAFAYVFWTLVVLLAGSCSRPAFQTNTVTDGRDEVLEGGERPEEPEGVPRELSAGETATRVYFRVLDRFERGEQELLSSWRQAARSDRVAFDMILRILIDMLSACDELTGIAHEAALSGLAERLGWLRNDIIFNAACLIDESSRFLVPGGSDSIHQQYPQIPPLIELIATEEVGRFFGLLPDEIVVDAISTGGFDTELRYLYEAVVAIAEHEAEAIENPRSGCPRACLVAIEAWRSEVSSRRLAIAELDEIQSLEAIGRRVAERARGYVMLARSEGSTDAAEVLPVLREELLGLASTARYDEIGLPREVILTVVEDLEHPTDIESAIESAERAAQVADTFGDNAAAIREGGQRQVQLFALAEAALAAWRQGPTDGLAASERFFDVAREDQGERDEEILLAQERAESSCRE